MGTPLLPRPPSPPPVPPLPPPVLQPTPPPLIVLSPEVQDVVALLQDAVTFVRSNNGERDKAQRLGDLLTLVENARGPIRADINGWQAAADANHLQHQGRRR